jgi:hypothetical protein
VPAAERAGWVARGRGEQEQAAADVGSAGGAREVGVPWPRRDRLPERRRCSLTRVPRAHVRRGAAVPAPPLVAQRIQQEGSSVRTGNLVKLAKAGRIEHYASRGWASRGRGVFFFKRPALANSLGVRVSLSHFELWSVIRVLVHGCCWFCRVCSFVSFSLDFLAR